ncbi:MAG: hypothetical protein ACK4P3_04670 [Fimbriimonadaceae bacterium]
MSNDNQGSRIKDQGSRIKDQGSRRIRALTKTLLFGSGVAMLAGGWALYSQESSGLLVTNTEIIDLEENGQAATMRVRFVNISPFSRQVALGSGRCSAKPMITTVRPLHFASLSTPALYSNSDKAFVGQRRCLP